MRKYRINLHSLTQRVTRPNNINQYAVADVIGSTLSPKSNLIFDLTDYTYPGQGVWIVGISLSINYAMLFSGMTSGFRVHFFNDLPVENTDNAQFALSAGDELKYMGMVALPTPINKGAFIQTDTNLTVTEFPIVLNTGTPVIVAQIETLSAFTPSIGCTFTLVLNILTT
ncbi:MAG: hypothetical protein NTV01_00445 [Bacteroidia bacterium]|nr:hypothetical protein [Bacteroidia bacterium]